MLPSSYGMSFSPVISKSSSASTQFQCFVCKKELDRTCYSIAQWRNRLARSATCNTCLNDRSRFLCAGPCQRLLKEGDFTQSQWRHRGDSSRSTVCKSCSISLNSFVCRGPCKRELPESGFDASQWKNRKDPNRKTLCRDCHSEIKLKRIESVENRTFAKRLKDNNKEQAPNFVEQILAVAAEDSFGTDDEKGLQNLVLAALNDV